MNPCQKGVKGSSRPAQDKDGDFKGMKEQLGGFLFEWQMNESKSMGRPQWGFERRKEGV